MAKPSFIFSLKHKEDKSRLRVAAFWPSEQVDGAHNGRINEEYKPQDAEEALPGVKSITFTDGTVVKDFDDYYLNLEPPFQGDKGAKRGAKRGSK